MAEEIGLKLKEQDLEKIKRILEEKEELFAGFPYGKKVFDTRWHQYEQPDIFDHFLVTNKRVIILKKEWFTSPSSEAMITFPFSVITSVDLREQVMGTTIIIKTEQETGNYEYTLENCPKRSGEFAYSFLKKMMGKILCHYCFKPIKSEFLFCPYCKNRLKNTCTKCGNILESDWQICPYCGSEKP